MSEQERDINEVFDDILLAEENLVEEGFEEGFKDGAKEGNPDGYHIGYHRGAELGAELGYYLGIATTHLRLLEINAATSVGADRTAAQLVKVKTLIESFPRTNAEAVDFLALADSIRTQYRKACSLLKIDGQNPPYHGFANAHTVNFIVDDSWTRFVPRAVRLEAEANGYRDAVEFFWLARERLEAADGGPVDGPSGFDGFPELYRFMAESWSHCIKVDEDICLSRGRFEEQWSDMKQVYRVQEFMSPKKYHEVRAMSRSVAAIARTTGATHCVDVGGGKGYLSAALAMLYGLRVLSVDCSDASLKAAGERQAKIERSWPHLVRKSGPAADCDARSRSYADRYKRTVDYITVDTDLERLVVDNFHGHRTGESAVRICLTGLHTCGDLAADSLRLFNASDCVTSLMNVPCCYNLLTERFDDAPAGVAAREPGGFPLSAYLKEINLNLGRNARMLAVQPIHKLSHTRDLGTRSLFFRALLQVILRDQYGMNVVPEGKMRGLADKCPDFDSYVARALKTIDFAPSRSSASALLGEHGGDAERLEVYAALRVCLAPVVESLILLDRLLYLAECGRDGCLVRLFDPVVSPRCHALVAIKRLK